MSEDRKPYSSSAETSTNGNHETGRNGKPATADRKRITFVVPAKLDRVLEAFCAVTGRQKMDVGIAALTDYLAKHRADFEASFETATTILDPVPASSRPVRRRRA
jgi:hypothetical protein